jgi:hypothetical protein
MKFNGFPQRPQVRKVAPLLFSYRLLTYYFHSYRAPTKLSVLKPAMPGPVTDNISSTLGYESLVRHLEWAIPRKLVWKPYTKLKPRDTGYRETTRKWGETGNLMSHRPFAGLFASASRVPGSQLGPNFEHIRTFTTIGQRSLF